VMHEIESLSILEWEEVQHDVGDIKFEPDWDLYFLLEERGYLMVFTVRDNKKLVGYFVVTINPNMHSKGNFIVSNDLIFLHPDYRKGFIGLKLFKFVEKCLVESGFTDLYVSTTERNVIDPLMFRMGYSKIETKFVKKIGI
jgi:GNAT superfamily N-acetyltransferase